MPRAVSNDRIHTWKKFGKDRAGWILTTSVVFGLGIAVICHCTIAFSLDPIGTRTTYLSFDAVAATTGVPMLYCSSDWLDMNKVKAVGLNYTHAWYLAYWLEILTGEQGRFGSNTMNGLPEYVAATGVIYLDRTRSRTMRVLETLEDTDPVYADISTRWRAILGEKPYENTEMPYLDPDKKVIPDGRDEYDGFSCPRPFPKEDKTILGSEAWDWTLLTSLSNGTDHFAEFFQDIVNLLQKLGGISLRELYTRLSWNPLIDNEEPEETEFRYGMVCHKFRLTTSTLSKTFKQQTYTRQLAVYDSNDTIIGTNKISYSRQHAVHISPYIGGLFPVRGGDDDTAFRTDSILTCNSGGFMKAGPPINTSEYSGRAITCHPCVDDGKKLRTLIQQSVSNGLVGKVDSDEIKQFGQRQEIDVYTMELRQFQRYPTRERKCRKVEGDRYRLPIYAEREKCVMQCRDIFVYQPLGNCSVVSFMFPEFSDLPPCTPSIFWKLIDKHEKENVRKAIETCTSQCRSVPRCTDLKAVMVKGKSLFVNVDVGGTYNLHEIMFAPTDVISVEEYPILPWDTFVSNLGGLVGMFFGLSLLNVLGIVFKCVSYKCSGKKGKIKKMSKELFSN